MSHQWIPFIDFFLVVVVVILLYHYIIKLYQIQNNTIVKNLFVFFQQQNFIRTKIWSARANQIIKNGNFKEITLFF